MKTQIQTHRVFAVFVMTILAFSFVTPAVLADDGSAHEVEIVDAGVTPDSALHGLDKALERISLALAFGKVKKAEIKLRIAEERLAEVDAMIRENKFDEATEAQEDHDEAVADAEELIDEVESDGDEETAEDAFGDVVRNGRGR